MVTIEVESRRKQELINITRQLAEAVAKEGWKDGICVVFTPHTTTGLTINENEDPNVLDDLISAFERIAPTEYAGYTHIEKNMAAHIKASLVGFSQMLIVADGKLLKGKYQDLYLCEFDGPRNRKVMAKFIADR